MTAVRPSGGSLITLISRIPLSAMCSVRGIGVAVMVSTSTGRPELLQLLLVPHAEALLLVDDDQAQILELDVLREQPVRADDDVHRAGGDLGHRPCSWSFRLRNRLSSSTFTGYGPALARRC